MSKKIKLRSFTDLGLKAVRSHFERVRADGELYEKNVEEIITNPAYTTEIKGKIEIDLDQTFETKLEMINYFLPIFSDAFLNKHKKNIGLWTWLAMAYYKQFLKKKGQINKTSATYCWIYDPDQYRFSRRHFVAGAIYLHRDFACVGEEYQEVFFSEPPYAFGAFIDAITYKEEFARIPAMLQLVVWLYHDPTTSNKVKRGAATQGRPGTVRELTRMSDHFAMTYDIFNLEDAAKLWQMLPEQFNKFKDGVKH